ncbi:RTA1-domain-containing protein [Aaosphaeria arxii CBS 175.79]|uniref:RTA1-domain-containing protein n=1 Tax=Aaosphaeria arxii CBS 175.79 TaxID=1450172 RepID=A0A6A5XXH6_9PLEO|nr:RTA1-domain-containing protein [Aaosphaeria arxii CBS 175.79]KAF2017603.1 RTA1-domain-containing protein [Aaosphaeria arxii CBS 175.79]
MGDRPPPQGYIDPNFPNPGTDGDATIIIYGYTPSIVVGVLGCVLFLVALIAHLFQLLKYRSWYFSTMIVGIAFEIVGYAFRCLSAKVSPYRVNFFVIQYFFIVVAPVFFAAAIYTVLSILINSTGRQYAPLAPKLILWIFITCDVVATIVQIAGAALIGIAYSNRKDPTTPNNILLGGLAFQAFSVLVFIILFASFMWKARRVLLKVVSKGFYFAFILSVIMIYLRVCFRLAETAEGLMENLSTHEVYFGTLEFMPVVIAVWLLAIWHPGRCVPKVAVRDVEGEFDGY